MRMVCMLQAEGIRIDGVGIRGRWGRNYPKNDCPIPGRTNYVLPFDRAKLPKPAASGTSGYLSSDHVNDKQ